MRPLGTPLRSLVTGQRGVTGLETAIILIAFVVVASVFAFTVLSTGIFSAERGKETIHAGLKEARSSLALKGSVIANGVADQTLSPGDSAWTALKQVTLAESAWTALANVTATADTTDKQEGTASADIAIGAPFITGLAAYENLSSTLDLSSSSFIRLQVKSSTTTTAGDVELVLDDTAGCDSPLENIDLPALVANTWSLSSLTITDNSDMTAVQCVGLNVVTDNGAQTVNLDEVLGRGSATADTTDKKEGSASAERGIEAGFATGLAFYEDFTSTVDLSSTDSLQLWVKSSVATNSGDIEIALDDTAGCGSTLELIDIPALVANTWKLATVAISDNSDMTAVKCVGLHLNKDNAAQTVNLDDITGRGQATSIVVTLTNALQGEPVDLNEPSDSDDNGLSDSDSINTFIITYSDSNQVARDVYWTQVFIGDNDSDNLLESGEKVEVTVTLKGLANANPVVKDTEFDLELRPEDGGVLVIERTMPDNVNAVQNLN